MSKFMLFILALSLTGCSVKTAGSFGIGAHYNFDLEAENNLIEE